MIKRNFIKEGDHNNAQDVDEAIATAAQAETPPPHGELSYTALFSHANFQALGEPIVNSQPLEHNLDFHTFAGVKHWKFGYNSYSALTRYWHG
eukprot:11312798-Karenia_brevis.AAC.1